MDETFAPITRDTLLKFARDGGDGKLYGLYQTAFAYPALGEWFKPIEGKLYLCTNGYHATLPGFLPYMNHLDTSKLFVAETMDEQILTGFSKVCCRTMRLVREVTTWRPDTIAAVVFEAARCFFSNEDYIRESSRYRRTDDQAKANERFRVSALACAESMAKLFSMPSEVFNSRDGQLQLADALTAYRETVYANDTLGIGDDMFLAVMAKHRFLTGYDPISPTPPELSDNRSARISAAVDIGSMLGRLEYRMHDWDMDGVLEDLILDTLNGIDVVSDSQ